MARRVDPRPRHQQIAAELRAAIMSGDLPPGEKLPTTADLMSTYEVTSQTVQRTLQVLKDEGFLVGRAGVGVFVRSELPLAIQPAAYMPPAEGGDPYRWLSEAEKRSQRGRIQLLEVGEVAAPRQVAEKFGLAEGSTCLRRHQLLTLDDEPTELASVYFPLKLAHDTALMQRKKIRGGAPRVLAELGYAPQHWVDRLSARLPTSEELLTLDLPDDAPVIRTFRVVYTQHERPVQVEILIKGSHRYELMYHGEVS